MNSVPEMPFDCSQVRVLIIEDEPLVAESVREILEDAGFTIAGVATKLAKALAIIEGSACDAAIVDANLAGVSASPAAEALLARNLPFIVLSGYAREQLTDDFFGGFFLKKPCRASKLIESLKTVLATR